jgi:hypothetical protein
MSIYRSNNPADFDDIDGIVVDESAPPSSVAGVATNVVCMVGQFERGPATLQGAFDSIGEIQELYGKSDTYSGSVALKNKKFGGLKLIRVVASDAVKASKAFQSSTTDRVTFTAKYAGVYGNSITVTIESGTTTGKKYTVKDTSANAVLPTEVYDNVAITAITAATFAASKLVDVTVNSTAAEPTNASATALALGADGTVADTDYQTAIAVAAVEGACNVLFLDAYNSTRNGYLKTHAAATQDKMCILSHAENDSVSTITTDLGNCRDSDGRLLYAVNWLQTTVAGVSVYTSPASWMASILSQTAPNVDPAFAKNVQYTAGATGVKTNYTRSQHITLMQAGACVFEFDADLGIKPKAGVTTQIVDTSKVPVLRRRMADYLTQSAGRFLKNYQNAVNSADNRRAIKSAILAFVNQNERDGMLPKDSEVSDGKAKLVDVDSLNTPTVVGNGFCYVLWKQRIYSSMRFLVLKAEIGTTVSVQEQA